MHENTGIMDLLKEATAEPHRDAERRRLQSEMVRGRLPAETYARWLGQMFLLHRALWKEIERRRAEHPPLDEIVRDEGLHVENLKADLALFGIDADEVTALASTQRAIRSIDLISRTDPLSLLGYNYVLEGSMNGNRFIARALEHGLAVPAITYLDPYGDEQRPVWQEYRERMNAAGFDTGQGNRMTAAARDMFRFVAELSEELMPEAVRA
jgi:heme oxygenase (biliverdin-producing, ferredoxin)